MATKKVTPATEVAKETVEVVKAEPAAKPVEATTEPAKTPAAKKATEKKTPEKKAPAKKTAAKKTTTTTKKTTAKKEIKVSTFVQYLGKQVEEKEIIANVKKAWTGSGKKVGDIKTMELYIKPEENAVYYVVNGTETGSVEF
ncbi:DUF6465 family protein [Bariatricus sp. SGI.154]|uniref:DUF6465 family protein n=1 Tax=Bariatricus sp. SGI.154 TaxID=3420549 RepID=UPI003D081DC6